MRYYLTLDLKDDPVLIAEYERLHERLRPEIEQSIREAGVLNMEIYRVGNRLFMLMETDDTFSFTAKAAADAANPAVQEWETFVWQYQQALPFAKPGEKWVLMNQIFALNQ
ncbi:MAG: L-rhamnose mutarotase [Spirosoma sp.]|nr:L-rhamnose mutarotase [Spirosoma sp.]